MGFEAINKQNVATAIDAIPPNQVLPYIQRGRMVLIGGGHDAQSVAQVMAGAEGYYRFAGQVHVSDDTTGLLIKTKRVRIDINSTQQGDRYEVKEAISKAVDGHIRVSQMKFLDER